MFIFPSILYLLIRINLFFININFEFIIFLPEIFVLSHFWMFILSSNIIKGFIIIFLNFPYLFKVGSLKNNKLLGIWTGNS